VIDGWFADPDAHLYEGQFWIYPTSSRPFDEQQSFEAFSSDDLVHWDHRGTILSFSDVPWSTNRAAWAPSVGYKNGEYYLYFSAGDGVGIGVAVSDSPEGPFQDPLGRALISDWHFGAQPIDAAIFNDDDGRSYLYYGGRAHCVVVEMDDDMTSFRGEFREITPPNYLEGSYMLKRHGVYYLMYSVGK
jgi:beta-xylosidase